MVPEVLILALDYYRAPLRFPHLADSTRPLPASLNRLVGAVGNALSPQNIESTARALNLEPRVVEEAFLFFLRQVLLAPGSSHYRVLGLTDRASDEDVRRHYHLLVRIFHPDRLLGDEERNVAYTARINEAYRVLKDPVTRRKYDRKISSYRETADTGGSTGDSVVSGKALIPRRFLEDSGTAPNRFLRRRLAIVLWLAGGALLMVAVLAVFIWRRDPALRANPDLADESVAIPYFLRKQRTEETDVDAGGNGAPEPGADSGAVSRYAPSTPQMNSKHGAASAAAD